MELFKEPFSIGETSLAHLSNRPKKFRGGVVFVCTHGEAEVSIDILHYRIKTGNAIILMPGAIASLVRASKDLRFRFVYMSEPLFHEVTFQLGAGFFRFIKENPVIYMKREHLTFMEKWVGLTEIILADRDNANREMMIRNMLECLFYEAFDKMKRFFGTPPKKTKRQDEIFFEFMTLVKDHCRTNRDVDFYAKKLFISPHYLSFVCTHTRRLSAKKLIDLRTILEIKVLLETTNEPVQKIAERMNFPDQSYLGRFFKRYTGDSPLAYRSKKGPQA